MVEHPLPFIQRLAQWKFSVNVGQALLAQGRDGTFAS